MDKPVILVLDGAQHAAIRAALALYISKDMGDPAYRPNDIHDIATGLDDDAPGEVISLDQEALEALASAPAFRLGAMPGDILAAVSGKESPSAAALLEVGVVLADRVSSRWESGDLAGAVGALQEWTDDVKDAFPSLDYSDDEEDADDEDEETDPAVLACTSSPPSMTPD